jgi:hypothetical protein
MCVRYHAERALFAPSQVNLEAALTYCASSTKEASLSLQ